MYCDRRGNGQKPTRTKPPGQKPLPTIEIEFVQGTFVRDFCTRPTKNRGSDMCDVLSGVPGCVTKCDRGKGGSKVVGILIVEAQTKESVRRDVIYCIGQNHLFVGASQSSICRYCV